MESKKASARPSRSANRPNYDAAVTASQPIVKNEDEDDTAPNTYRPRPQLPQPFTLMRQLAALMKYMEDGIIDVDPEYQREVVWTADRMTGLIDSLMENFYIPPIILNRKPRPSQNGLTAQEYLVCVDGKQRLSSVLAFVKGMIPCHDHRGEKWWYCETAGNKRKRILPEQLQKQFLQKQFCSFEYVDLSPEQEEDLFARVQMGVQLNLAEKMRASTGPWQELARLFVEDFPTVFSLMKDRARSKDFQLTLSCFSQIVECMHPTNSSGVPILKTNHSHLPKLLSNKGAVDDSLKSHLASVWNTFKDLIEADPDTFTNANKYLRGVQTFAPIEMVAVTVLISMHSETRNNRLLLGDIQAMRTAARESFVDLRLNAPVWKWFWDYIDDLEAIRGAIDGSTVNRRTKQRTEKSSTRSAENAAAGSTASAIAAAAAAPKKGRATARTKRPAAATPEETVVVVKQEQALSAPSYARSPKRRRNGDSPFDNAATTSDQSKSVPFVSEAQRSALPLLHESHPKLSMRSMPTDTATQSPQPGPQKPPSRATPAPSAPLITAPMSRNTPSFVDTAPMFSNSASPSIQGGRMPESVTPETQTTLRVPPPAQAHSTQKLRKSSSQHARTQYEGAIDLTSDSEQERQDLLSAFKAKPTAAEPPKSVRKPITTTPAAQKRQLAANEQGSLREFSTRDNNPYASLKNR